MKVAVISDIHGNMQALGAVLEDIKKERCDKIFCLGDLAMAGPEPVKTLELLKKMHDNSEIIIIQGNTDEMIANCEISIPLVKEKFPIMGNALENDCELIPDNLKTFLQNLPKNAELEIEGVNILLVHGSPRKNDENILPEMKQEQIEEIISGVDADVIFCGHTHMPCGYMTNSGKIVVNDGSVGRPFTQNPQACYVVAKFNDGKTEITHKFLDYDRQKAAEILSMRTFEGADKLAQILINPEFRHI